LGPLPIPYKLLLVVKSGDAYARELEKEGNERLEKSFRCTKEKKRSWR